MQNDIKLFSEIPDKLFSENKNYNSNNILELKIFLKIE
jgi:hypothetical protein